MKKLSIASLLLTLAFALPAWAQDTAQDAPADADAAEGGDDAQAPIGPMPTLSSPLYYRHMSLIVVHESGVAVFRALQHEQDRVRYAYRLLTVEGEEEAGQGVVCEVYKDIDGVNTRINEECVLYIQAGDISFEWSMGGNDMGWIYYRPDELTIMPMNTRFYEDLNLRLFLPEE